MDGHLDNGSYYHQGLMAEANQLNSIPLSLRLIMAKYNRQSIILKALAWLVRVLNIKYWLIPKITDT